MKELVFHGRLVKLLVIACWETQTMSTLNSNACEGFRQSSLHYSVIDSKRTIIFIRHNMQRAVQKKMQVITLFARLAVSPLDYNDHPSTRPKQNFPQKEKTVFIAWRLLDKYRFIHYIELWTFYFYQVNIYQCTSIWLIFLHKYWVDEFRQLKEPDWP